ncbi:MAG: nucleoside triphosphate hydrolase [Rhodobacter sp.]|nr:nucleoside triphosphate hydrolase [Rhodobacter sp.]
MNLTDLATRISALTPTARRRLVAIAGPPASGKSTLASDLVAALGPRAVLVPMDGFHLDNRLLDARGLRPRKGAPETFDADGFVAMIRRIANDDEVVLPVFDRSRDLAIAGAEVVSPKTDIAVVEGNYLLLNRPPWSQLHPIWDLSVSLDVPLEELEQRLIQRWLDHGLSATDATARAQSNDLPNARLVLEQSVRADIRL